MDYRRQILNAAKKYCKATGKSRATVATSVMNDGKFFDRIENGGGCTMDTFQKVMDYLNNNMPIVAANTETVLLKSPIVKQHAGRASHVES